MFVELHSIACGNFKMDGGAMFTLCLNVMGKSNPADASNRVKMCSRSLLIENGNRLILIDTGMGNKVKSFLAIMKVGEENLDQSLSQKDFTETT